MKTVTIERNALLAAVKKNRTQHLAEFTDATANYRTKVLEAIDQRRDEIAAGAKVNLHFHLPELQNHTDDYDRVISMLEMSVDKDCTLDSHEFDQYVRDNWTWSAATKMINGAYASVR